MNITTARKMAKDPSAYTTAQLAEAIDFVIDCDTITETQVTNLLNKLEPNFRARVWDRTEPGGDLYTQGELDSQRAEQLSRAELLNTFPRPDFDDDADTFSDENEDTEIVGVGAHDWWMTAHELDECYRAGVLMAQPVDADATTLEGK